MLNPDVPLESAYKLNYQYDQQQGNLYSTIQKYLKKAISQVDNATTVISN
jgi:hypothetical protein